MFPVKLTEYLQEQMMEGHDVHYIAEPKSDALTWVIIPTLEDWVIICQWYEGSENYDLINLQGCELEYVRTVATYKK